MFDIRNDATWMEEAKCYVDNPGSLFDYDKYQSPKHKRAVEDFCSQCPVKSDCLFYANENNVSGIWAATTERQRRAIKKKARKSVLAFLERQQAQLPDDEDPIAS